MITSDERRAIAERIDEISWDDAEGSWTFIDRLCRAMGLDGARTYKDDMRAITGKVRELCESDGDAYQRGYDEGFASADDWYADRTDAELSAHGLIRMPKGADGEPIRPGDVVTHPDMGSRQEVTSVCLTGEGVSVGCADGFVTLRTDLLSHADTPLILADEIDAIADLGGGSRAAVSDDELRAIARRLRALGGGGDE